MHKPDGSSPVYVFVCERGDKTCSRECECGVNTQLYEGVCYVCVKINFIRIVCKLYFLQHAVALMWVLKASVLAHVGRVF